MRFTMEFLTDLDHFILESDSLKNPGDLVVLTFLLDRHALSKLFSTDQGLRPELQKVRVSDISIFKESTGSFYHYQILHIPYQIEDSISF